MSQPLQTANSVQDLKALLKSEYQKCASDPAHFMKKYCKIQHPTKGKLPFHLFPFQENVLRDFRDYDRNIVLKSRQMGISTLCAGYAIWLMTFFSDKNILVIATKQETAKNLVTKVKTMHEGLPSWLRKKHTESNKLSLRFENGSQIKAVSSATDSARSEGLSLLIIDEAAFIDSAEEIWTAAQQTLNTGGSAIVLSTPNGTGNFFHKTWVKSEEGLNEFHRITLKWDLHPERDQSWRDKQDAELGGKLAAQECDCSFISSGYTVVDGPTLEWYNQNMIKSPLEVRGFDQNMWIWEYPDYSKDYMVVADVSRGDGNDYSAFHVIDIDAVKQVAEYKGQLNTTDFGNMLVSVSTEYNNALLVIENANIGWAVIQTVLDRRYPNVYYSPKDQSVDMYQQLNRGVDLRDTSQMVAGFTNSTRTRPLVISKLDLYMRDRSPIIYSKRLLEELYVFIWNGSKAEAQQGYNDDLVMPFAIALWLRDSSLRMRQAGIELNRKALNAISTGAGIYGASQLRRDHGWSMPSAHGDEDLLWLLR